MPSSILHLDSDARLKLLQCCNSGIQHPHAPATVGCYAVQPNDYDRFKPFLGKVLTAYHNVRCFHADEAAYALKNIACTLVRYCTPFEPTP